MHLFLNVFRYKKEAFFIEVVQEKLTWSEKYMSTLAITKFLVGEVKQNNSKDNTFD